MYIVFPLVPAHSPDRHPLQNLLLQTRLLALRYSAANPCIFRHRYIFYHVYRQTRLFRAAALNNKFLSQRARRSRSCLFAQIHSTGKTFANFGEKCFRADGFRQMRFRAKSFGGNHSGKSLFGRADSSGWVGILPPDYLFRPSAWMAKKFVWDSSSLRRFLVSRILSDRTPGCLNFFLGWLSRQSVLLSRLELSKNV